MEIIKYILVILLGMTIGSFFGMLYYRLKNNVPLIKEKWSFCPICKIRLHWWNNIPIFSFLFQRGKCSNCKNPISKHYIIIEVITLLIFIIIYTIFIKK